MMARVRVENQLSREREKVVVAATASSIGGQRGDDREQEHDADVKPGAGELGAPGAPHADSPARR